MKRLVAGLLLLVLGTVATSHAAEDFDALPAAERTLLASAREQWSQLGADQQAALVVAARQWLAMDANERAAVRAREPQLPTNEEGCDQGMSYRLDYAMTPFCAREKP